MNALCAKYENRKYIVELCGVILYTYQHICECNHLSRSSNERERSKHLKSELKRIYSNVDIQCVYGFTFTGPRYTSTHRCYQFNAVINDANTA